MPIIDDLIQFVRDRLVMRSDGYGLYKAGKSWTEKTPLTDAMIRKHFEGKVTIGLHPISIDNMCKWVAWDIDAHDGDGRTAEGNLKQCEELCRKLEQRGFNPLVEDSNGKGGLHVWLFFDAPIPAADAYKFALEMCPDGCEAFPKQPRVCEAAPWGNFIRIPGRHYKHRDHWSRFRVGGEWFEGSEAWAAMLDREPDDAGLVPRDLEPPESPATAPEYASSGIGTEDKGEENELDAAVDCLKRLGEPYVSNYPDWIRVGILLKRLSGGRLIGLAHWDEWSRKSVKYESGCCERKWPELSGTEHPNPITVGTLIHWSGGDRSSVALDKLQKALPVEHLEGRGIDVDERSKIINNLCEILGLPVVSWIQRGRQSGHESYYLVLKGTPDDILIGRAAAVLSYTAFRSAVYAQTGHTISVNRKKWDAVCKYLGKIVDVIDIPEDSRHGIMESAVEQYLADRSPSSDMESALQIGAPFTGEGCVWVHLIDLIQQRKVARDPIPTPYKIAQELGWMRQTFNYTNHRGERSTRSYWRIDSSTGDSKCKEDKLTSGD